MTDSINILIIGGKSDLREELTSNLRKTGFTVTVVLGYIEARWILDHLYPDMIIMDEVMPHGLRDTVACFRLHHDYGIPVILLCKDACGEPWIGVAENGADFYFTRPANHQEFVDRVKAILQRSKKELSGQRMPLTTASRRCQYQVQPFTAVGRPGESAV